MNAPRSYGLTRIGWERFSRWSVMRFGSLWLGWMWVIADASAQYQPMDASEHGSILGQLQEQGREIAAVIDGCRMRTSWSFRTPLAYSSAVDLAARGLPLWTSGESLLELRSGSWYLTASDRILGVGAALDLRAVGHLDQLVLPRARLGNRVGAYEVVDAEAAKGLPSDRRIGSPFPALAVGLVGPTSFGCLGRRWCAASSAIGTVHGILRRAVETESAGRPSSIGIIVRFDWIAPYGAGMSEPELYFTPDLRFRGYSFTALGEGSVTKHVYHVTEWIQVGGLAMPSRGILFRLSNALPAGHELAAVSEFETSFEERVADPTMHWPSWRPGDQITDHRASGGSIIAGQVDPAIYQYSVRPDQILESASGYVKPKWVAGESEWWWRGLIFALGYILAVVVAFVRVSWRSRPAGAGAA